MSAQIRDQSFEYKYSALVLLRAKNRGYKFKLASNVKGLGAFDDVVLEYLDDNCSKRHIFLQLKSKVKQKITVQQLLAGKGDFSLRKYYDSYIQVEENFNCSEEGVKMDGRIDECLFIIYTNTDVVQELKSKKVTEFNEEEFLMTGSSVLQFNEEEHKAIYQHLQELPKHREFLSRFRIFYSQADEREMDNHIKHELQQSIKFPESELDLACMCYIDFVKDWWQKCNYFLKENNSKEHDPLRKTSEEVSRTLVTKILDQRKSELDNLSIKYKESAITDIERITEPHKAVLIFTPGRTTTLTAAKIHQMLSATKHIILNLQQLVHYKSEIMVAWKNNFDVLVVESQILPENFQDVFSEISIILNECGVEKRSIFIANTMGNTQQIRALRRTFSTKLRVEYDDCEFTDIVNESRTFILEKEITFQGSVIQIKNIVRESDVHMLNALDCDSISLLLGDEKPSVGIPIEGKLDYYIDRTLECTQHIKTGTQNESVLLRPFRKESWEELQGTSAYRAKECNITDKGQGITELSQATDNEKEPTRECNETTELQGWKTEDQQHPCKENNDDNGNERRDLERKSTRVWRPRTLLEGESRIVMFVGEAGMGKSTLLTHLAMEARKCEPNVWVIKVNINKHTRILHEIKTKGFDENGALKLLSEAAQIKETEDAQLEKQLFNYTYSSTGNMAVLIDGADEVSPHYTEEVLQVLKLLLKKKIRKIWVTSRNSVRDQIEEELQCQTYSLTPLSVQDQKSFLVKFWNQKYLDTQEEYLEDLASRVVDLSLEYLSDGEKNFMEVPLHAILVAEMFEENLNQCSTSTTVELPKYINQVMLYDLYLNRKWDIYLSDKKFSDQTNVNMLTDDDFLRDVFIDNHKAAALKVILSIQFEWFIDKKVLQQGADFLQKINQGLEKTGIINSIIEGRPVFQHQPLAEYLAARWLCDNFQNGQTFRGDLLFESRFRGLRSMVDRILAEKCPLHEAVLNSDLIQVERLLRRRESINQKDRGGRTPLHLAISCRNPELIRLLLQHEADVRSVDKLLGLSPVEYAIRMKDLEIMSLLEEY